MDTKERLLCGWQPQCMVPARRLMAGSCHAMHASFLQLLLSSDQRNLFPTVSSGGDVLFKCKLFRAALHLLAPFLPLRDFT